jgi:heme oxygenase
VHDALGWAFVIERSTLAHPNLFRHLAGAIPGEVAFASSYLKCYFGGVGEMWRSFGEDLEASVGQPSEADRLIDASKTGFRHYRRWRTTLDGSTRPVSQSDQSPTEAVPRGRT